MGGRRIAFVAAIALAGLGPLGVARADEPEIEMDPQPAQPKPPTPAPQPAPTPTPAPEGKNPQVMRRWQYAAQQLVQQGDYFTRYKKLDEAKAKYEGAVTAYQKAIEAGDDLSLIVELAAVEDKLGKFDEAARHLRSVTTNPAAKPDLVKKAQQKLDDVATKLGVVVLKVQPEGATISLGGTEIGKAPLAAPLYLLPGKYTVSFTAEGYQPKEAELEIEAGSESERTIDLDKVKVIVELPPPKQPEVELPKPASTPSKVPLYAGAGLTVAFFGTGVVTGILAIGQHSTFVAPDSNAADRADAKANGRTLAHVTDLCLVGAVASAGFTTYWYLYKYKKGAAKPKEERRIVPPVAKVDVVPWVQPDAGGLTVAGSF